MGELVPLVAAAVALVAAVAAAWFARDARVLSQRGTVDELADAVAKIAAQQRKDTMRRVRAAAPGAEGGVAAVPTTGELFQPPQSTAELKQQLRRQLFRAR